MLLGTKPIDSVEKTNGKTLPFISAVVIPMTIEPPNGGPPASDQGFVRVESLQQAFDLFRPNLDIRLSAEPGWPEIRVGCEFRSLDDFDPAHLQKYRRIAGKEYDAYRRNDLADQRSCIDALTRLLSVWEGKDVQRLWKDCERRRQTTNALALIRDDLKHAAEHASTIREIFGHLPGFLSHECNALMLLASLSAPLAEGDTHDETIEKIQKQLDQQVSSQSDLLQCIFRSIRAVERSYHLVDLFFQNACGPEAEPRRTELYVLNADIRSIRDPSSSVLDEIESFLRGRNQNLVFADDVSVLVVPGLLAPWLRTRLEQIASSCCAILISDADVENSVSGFETQCRVDGKYEFLRLPRENALHHLVVVGRVRLRPGHWFEAAEAEVGLYGDASLVFAGALARTGAIGVSVDERLMWPLVGCEESRPGFGSGCFDHLAFEQQVVSVVRPPSGMLQFEACRAASTLAEGILRSFYARRVVFFLRTYAVFWLDRLSGSVLTRKLLVEEVEAPLEQLLRTLAEQGVLLAYSLDIDKDYKKRMQGICDITISIRVPGMRDSLTIEPEVPRFQSIRSS